MQLQIYYSNTLRARLLGILALLAACSKTEAIPMEVTASAYNSVPPGPILTLPTSLPGEIH